MSAASTPDTAPDVSIVIVNYRASEYVRQSLRSLRQAQRYEHTEIIIVDNASQDRSRQAITEEFPEVQWIGLKSNIGFGKACNVGAQKASGTYLLLLNPDTVVSRNTLAACIEFMDTRPDVGILGPKILNPDGTLQPSCRRSFPTPLVAFSHLFGLSKLFPRSRLFGKYNLTYLDPDTSAQVDAVSGSFMFMRTKTFRTLGGFDEAFFMYGEDLDLCARTRQHGYTVWYYPETQIIHFKGRSAAKQPLRSRAAFYEAMVLFSRKYRDSYGTFFPGWLVGIGIAIQAGINIGATLFTTFIASIIDLVILNVVLWAGISIRFHFSAVASPYQHGLIWYMVGLHTLLSVIFLTTFAIRGVYSTNRYSSMNALLSGFIASALFLTGVYFIGSMAFSRLAFAFSTLLVSLALPLWRALLPTTMRGFRRLVYSTGRVVIVGNSDVAALLIRNTEEDRTANITGIIWPNGTKHPVEFQGYPVLGGLEHIHTILQNHHAQQLIIATTESWYSHVIEALATTRLRHLTIKWVRNEYLTQPPEQLPEILPLQNFSI
jgi:GT2 family glycosyltransferase